MLCPHCRNSVHVLPQLAGRMVACGQCGGQFVARADAFDPYYTWLGIPPADQPPTHYRLLGLQLFEANPTVIENAADRQMRHLHSMRTGAHAAESQRLLNEVAAARVCLLDPTCKAPYDRQLQARAQAPAPPPLSAGPLGSPFAPPAASSQPGAGAGAVQGSLADQSGEVAPPPRQAAARRSTRTLANVLSILFIGLGGVIGLGIGVLAVFYLTGQDFLGLSGRLRPKAQRVARADIPERGSEIAPAPTPAFQPPVTIDNKTEPQSVEPVQQKVREFARQPAPAPPNKAAEPRVAERPLPRAPKAPLANVPASRDLPELTSAEPSLLFELAAEPAADLEMTIHADAASLPSGARMLLERDVTATKWKLHCIANDGSALEDNFATIQRHGLEVSLGWNEPLADSAIRRQLANCLLEVRMGAESRVMQLREPIRGPALLLDLDVDKQVREFEISDLPVPQKLYLQVTQLEKFAKAAKLRGQADTFAVGKPAVIEFGEMPGAEIELRLFRKGAGPFEFRSEPVFRERGEKEFELTRPRLDAVENSVRSSLEKFQAEIVALEANKNAYVAEIQRLSAMRPSNPSEALRQKNEIARLNRAVQTALGSIAHNRRQMRPLQARLDAVPAVRGFIDSLHKRAAIYFVVAVPCGNHQLILVDAQQPP